MNKYSLVKKNNRFLIVANLLFFIFLVSCAPKCSDAEARIIRAAEKGDLVVVKRYLEDGGDPMLSCSQYGGKFNFSSQFFTDSGITSAICQSKSKELISYYFSLDLDQSTKDYFLDMNYYAETDNDLLKLFITKDAHVTPMAEHCFFGENLSTYFDQLKRNGYDFNWVDPMDGNNILMKYLGCSAETDEEDLLKLARYFVGNGVKTNVVNKKGETAFGMTNNEQLLEALKAVK